MSHRHPIDTKARALELYNDLRSEPVPDALAAALTLVSDARDVLWGTTPTTPAETRAFSYAASMADRLACLASTAMEIAVEQNMPPLHNMDLVYDEMPWTPHLDNLVEASMCLGVTEKLYMSINDRIRHGHDFWPYGGTDSMVEAASLALQPFALTSPLLSDPAYLYLERQM